MKLKALTVIQRGDETIKPNDEFEEKDTKEAKRLIELGAAEEIKEESTTKEKKKA